MIDSLLTNISILISVSIVYSYISKVIKNKTALTISNGILFGLFAIVAMMNSFNFGNGIIFDGRSIVLSVAALFAGPIAALISMVIAGLYRLFLGGSGLFMGISVIIVSVLIGMIYRGIVNKNQKYFAPVYIYLFGIAVHVAMILLMFTLPSESIHKVIETISIPILVFFPLATLIIVLVLKDFKKKYAIEKQLFENEEKLRAFFESDMFGTIFGDIYGNVYKANDEYLRIVGYTKEDLISGNLKWDKITPSEFLPLDTQRIDEAKEKGSCTPYEKQYIRKDGTRVWVLVGYILVGNEKEDSVAFILDISKRKNNELKLIESEKRFRLLYENAPLAYQSLDESGRLIDVNNTWLDFLQYNRQEVIGHFFGDFMPLSSAKLISERLPLFLRQGEIHNAEFEMVKKDGSIVTVEYEGKVGYDEWGQFKQTHCIFIDITERKRALQALKESEEKYRTLFETMAQGVTYITPKGIITSANQAASRILGVPVDRLIGMNMKDNLWNSIHEDGREFDKDEYPTILALQTGKTIYKVVMGIRNHESKQYKWIKIDSIPQFQPGSKAPFQVYTMFDEITDRKEAEIEIKKNKELLELTGKISKVGGWEFDPMTGEGIWTDEVANIHDVDPSLETNKDFGLSFYINDSKEKLEKAIKDLVEKEIPYDLELEMKTAKGVHKWVKTIGIPVIKEGKVVKVTGIFQDITERKKMIEELIIAKEKAEEINRLKSSFFANMSHELRTPLVGILGYADILRDEELTSDQKEMAQTIFKSGTRLLDTLNSILTISKIESEKQTVNLKRLQISEIIKQSVETFAAAAAQKGLNFILEIEDSSITVVLDEHLFREIMNNLISNAIKYTLNGEVKISVFTQTEQSAKYAIISVKDSGIGIPEKSLKYIFDEFRQVSEGYNRYFEGTGLGLSIAKKYIEIMGGTISVNSIQGNGSEFIIKIRCED